jgi:hypothetical protein
VEIFRKISLDQVLGEVDSQDILPGVLKLNFQNIRKTRNPVMWPDRVHRNL